MAIRAAGLFAGIGGLELGLAEAKIETELLADSDPAAQAVLQKRFPDAEIVGDVAKVRALPSDLDIVTAGFPCQNLSMAGNKAGIGGAKSTIVDELFRLLKDSDVPLVVVENVYFMLHLARGAGMKRLTTGFEELGYRWAYRVLDTLGFGLPQRRRRVFLIASKDLDPCRILFADESERPVRVLPIVGKPIGFYWTEGRSGVGLTGDAIPPLKGGSGWGIPSTPAVLLSNGRVVTPTIEACEALQGFCRGWTDAAIEVDAKSRWKLVGNAVSVPVASWLAKRIVNPGDMLKLNETSLKAGDPWPSAAYGKSGERTAVSASSRPIDCGIPSLSDYVEPDWRPLSDRALTGFLGRAREGRLKFPDGFLDALDEELAKRPPSSKILTGKRTTELNVAGIRYKIRA
jgi:DNA (cytosine-5)-methyltransferase 1